ncbi:hypothetical protein K439DRAFT_930346 [Ramaria rubella]|nr:hypothetical protein K439DRAFT_930346 [Ramaria rubella]
MLTIARTPLTSPALRTVTLASSHVSQAFPFQYSAAPSSPLSRPAYSPLTYVRMPSSRATRDLYNTPTLRSPGLGGYFNLGPMSSPTGNFSTPCSPKFAASPPITKSILYHHNAPLSPSGPTSQALSSAQHIDHLAPTLQSNLQSRRKLTFSLNLPRPSFERDESFEVSELAFTPGTPCELSWSDSYDSIRTLKPLKERIPTPYPKIDESEWIDDIEEAIRG